MCVNLGLPEHANINVIIANIALTLRYYHFDYVGDPRNYKWINTIQLQKTWEQMTLAYDSGIRNIWIANVGDLKGLVCWAV
jgi:hypothetical protein